MNKNLYSNVRAVSDENIITTSRIAPVECDREIFHKLDIFDDRMLEK